MHDGESTRLQALATQVHPNDALPVASDSQLSQALAEGRRLWILNYAPGHYEKIYSSDDDTPVHSLAVPVPANMDQQCLPCLPHDGESPALPQDWESDVQPNDALAYSDADTTSVHFSFGPLPFHFGFGQQYPSGLPHDGESAAQPQDWESEVHLDVFRFSPPGLTQLPGGAQDQPPGTAQSTSPQEAKPHWHSSAAGGKQPSMVQKRKKERKQHSCESCRKVFARSQELKRHIGAVHNLNSPPKCRFCPHTSKRAYLMKEHLLNDHQELAEDILNRIRDLRGMELSEFVDTTVNGPPQSSIAL